MATVACVQMCISTDDFRSEEVFCNRILQLAQKARDGSNDPDLLLVFPEHVGTFCLLCDENDTVFQSKSLAEAVSRMIRRRFIKVARTRIRKRVSWIRALALHKQDIIRSIYVKAFSTAARVTESWIVAGSAVLESDYGDLQNMSYLFAPNGKVVLRQGKVNLVDMEGKQGLDISPADLSALATISSPFGSLGIAVCLDAFHAPVLEHLSHQGANLLIQPSANNRQWDEWQQQDWLRGGHHGVMGAKLFATAVNPMLVGRIWDLRFSGQSSIISQYPKTATHGYFSMPEIPGMVAVSESSEEEELLFFPLEA